MTFILEIWEAELKVQCVRIGHLSDDYAKHNKEALYITSVTTNCC